MHGAGRRWVVDQQNRGDNVVIGGLTLHRAGDCMVGDEVLHIFLGGKQVETGRGGGDSVIVVRKT